MGEEHPISGSELDRLTQNILETIRPAYKDPSEQLNLKGFLPKKKRTYSQDWPAYNKAKQIEKIKVLEILDELLSYIKFPKHNGVGRKPIRLRDQMFYLVLKAYNGLSSRRIISDLHFAKEKEMIEKVPHFNTVLNCLRNPVLIPYLKKLISVSALPLKSIEDDLAVDSSGFADSRFERWFDVRLGKMSDRKKFKKLHIICGTRTNIILFANITKGTSGDSPQFKDLIENASKLYNIKRVSADKAYSSRANLEKVREVGAIPFIPFKENATGRSKGSGVWKEAYLYWKARPNEFLQHYHRRSNVETTFFMLKEKLGDYVRSKDEVAQTNELLVKCLAHNLCVLVQEVFELGIDASFQKHANVLEQLPYETAQELTHVAQE